MPYQLIWEDNGVYWKYSGDVSGKEVFKATMQAYGDARFDEVKYKLVDFLDVEQLDMDESMVTAIAGQHRLAEQNLPNVKNAIVMPAEYKKYATLFSELLGDSSWDVQVFDNLEAASQWLGRKSVANS